MPTDFKITIKLLHIKTFHLKITSFNRNVSYFFNLLIILLHRKQILGYASEFILTSHRCIVGKWIVAFLCNYWYLRWYYIHTQQLIVLGLLLCGIWDYIWMNLLFSVTLKYWSTLEIERASMNNFVISCISHAKYWFIQLYKCWCISLHNLKIKITSNFITKVLGIYVFQNYDFYLQAQILSLATNTAIAFCVYVCV